MSSVRAFAPGTVANLGPGLDVLGLALEGVGDEVVVSRSEEPGLTVEVFGSSEIPTDPARNTAAIAALEVLRRARAEQVGLRLEVHKGLPLAGGQGGSAASAAAAAIATDALLTVRLSRGTLLQACLAAEMAVAGRHADNAAAALYGGVVLVRSLDPIDAVSLRYPSSLKVVVVRPSQRLATEQARAALPPTVSRETAISQAAQVGALVAALASGDLDLLARSVEDRIAEPARQSLLPGFAEAKKAALAAGARGCSISGAGPSTFAFAENEAAGHRVADAMVAAYQERAIPAQSRVFSIDIRGARILGGAA